MRGTMGRWMRQHASRWALVSLPEEIGVPLQTRAVPVRRVARGNQPEGRSLLPSVLCGDLATIRTGTITVRIILDRCCPTGTISAAGSSQERSRASTGNGD